MDEHPCEPCYKAGQVYAVEVCDSSVSADRSHRPFVDIAEWSVPFVGIEILCKKAPLLYGHLCKLWQSFRIFVGRHEPDIAYGIYVFETFDAAILVGWKAAATSGLIVGS